MALQTLADVKADRDWAKAGQENCRAAHGTESIGQILADLAGERGEGGRDGSARGRGPGSNLICAIHRGRQFFRLRADARSVLRQSGPKDVQA
ncbi:hypothetical protein ACHAPE_009824 [Trichoderma viride]